MKNKTFSVFLLIIFIPSYHAFGDKTIYFFKDTPVKSIAFNNTINSLYQGPVVNNAPEDKYFSMGEEFKFNFPENTFGHPTGKPLTYEVFHKANNQYLPIMDWMVFDPQNREFSGRPPGGSVGEYPIIIRATDPDGLWAETEFLVVVINNTLPIAQKEIPDIQIGARAYLSMIFDEDTFFDPDGDPLKYSAYHNGGPLPGWLEFDPVRRHFHGTSELEDIGDYRITVRATDKNGGEMETFFTISILDPTNLPIMVINQIDDVTIFVGDDFNYILTKPFVHNFNKAITLTSFEEFQPNLPNWLTFDSGNLVYNGVPEIADIGIVDIILQAQDPDGYTAAQKFTITVRYGDGDLPILVNPIPDKTVEVNKPFTFIINDKTFVDPEGKKLIYEVRNGDDTELDDWVLFNGETLTFTGEGSFDELGIHVIKVIAINEFGSAETTFNLRVYDDNFVPHIYPNPVRNEFTIHLGPTNASMMDILIVDSMGRTVFRKNSVTIDGDKIQGNLSNTNMAVGRYFLKILLNNNESKVIEFIKIAD
jgi:hypothetical protein